MQATKLKLYNNDITGHWTLPPLIDIQGDMTTRQPPVVILQLGCNTFSEEDIAIQVVSAILSVHLLLAAG